VEISSIKKTKKVKCSIPGKRLPARETGKASFCTLPATYFSPDVIKLFFSVFFNDNVAR
jgi:hypothetical protein